MMERAGDGEEDEEVVLPMPGVTEQMALRKELERLDGNSTDGAPSLIAVPRPGGSGWVYLSGRRTLFTVFQDGAYVLGTEDAGRLIEQFPTVLEGAEVVVRGRRGPRS